MKVGLCAASARLLPQRAAGGGLPRGDTPSGRRLGLLRDLVAYYYYYYYYYYFYYYYYYYYYSTLQT